MPLSLAPARRLAVGLAGALVIAGAAAATAHVAAAIGDNNRYLKVTALADRVRLSYTVFYGETPGAELRQALDTNHDGAIDDAETEEFGGKLARDIAGSLVIALDGAPAQVAWSQVVVGLGTPKVAAAADTVDLVAWLCLAAPGGKHSVLLRDHYPIARPGETQVVVEDSPGVVINATRIGGAIDEAHEYTLVGPSGALDTEGLAVQLTAQPTAPVTSDANCRRPAPPQNAPVAAIASLLSVGVGALVLGVVVLVRRRRRPAAARRARSSLV